MIENPKVGQKCQLSDEGMASVQGLRSAEQVKQAKNMIITFVGENLTSPEVTLPIHVDAPLIDRFIITNWDVDLLDED